MKYLQFSIFGVILLVTGSVGQLGDLDLWDLGTQYFTSECAKGGTNLGLIPGLPIDIPIFDDPWFLLLGTCKTFEGSVGCETEDGETIGKCSCNQGEDQEFDGENCVGKVGAYCTAEDTSLIPQKKCVPNAHCIPVQGEGYAVGTCECVDGYDPVDRSCRRNISIPEGTARPITTTDAPPKSELQLPLGLLFSMKYDTFGQDCQSEVLLNRTYCAPYGLTVSCLKKKCQCNMEEDSIFDDNLNRCVGRHGSYCLARQSIMGWKVCTEGADCVVEEGRSVDEYSFGTCQCMYGYNNEADGTCTRDESIPNPSTIRPGGYPTPTPAPIPEPTIPPPRQGASAMESKNIVVLSMALLCILSVIYSR